MAYLHNQNIDYVAINTRFYRHTLEGIALAEAKGIRPIIVDHGSAHLTMGSKLVDPFVATVEHAVTELVKRHSADYYAVSFAGTEWLRHFGIEAAGCSTTPSMHSLAKLVLSIVQERTQPIRRNAPRGFHRKADTRKGNTGPHRSYAHLGR